MLTSARFSTAIEFLIKIDFYDGDRSESVLWELIFYPELIKFWISLFLSFVSASITIA